MTDRAEFLKRRRGGIGGSDVGPILGVDRYRDSLDVYIEKVTPPKGDDENSNMQRGRMLEPIVSQMYMETTGRKLRPGKFRQHRDHKFLIGHPDRIIVAAKKPPFLEPMDGPGVLEIKTANRHEFTRFQSEGIPQTYMLQLQHYMAITGTNWGAFAILCPDPWEFLTFNVTFDADLFATTAPILDEFWTHFVLPKQPPMPAPLDWGDAPKPTSTVLQRGEDAEWVGALLLLREAKAELATAKQQEDFAKSLLKAAMTDDKAQPLYGVHEGSGARVYYTEQPGRRTFQTKPLQASEPVDRLALSALLSEGGMSVVDIEKILEQTKLDLNAFYKQGEPFAVLKLFDTRE